MDAKFGMQLHKLGKPVFRLIREHAELLAIAAEWRKLLEQSSSHEAMLDPSWLLAWWRHYGAGSEIAVGLIYVDDELVGLAPMCIRRFAYRLGIAFKRLQFMGRDANENDGVFSEYLSFIARRGCEGVVAGEFVNRIVAGDFGVWDEVVLAAMKRDTAIVQRLIVEFEHHGELNYKLQHDMWSYHVTLPKSWDAYLESLPSRKRYYVKSSLAKFFEWASENGTGWQLRHVTDDRSFEEGLSILIALHETRWRSGGYNGAFSSDRFAAFHRDFAATAISEGKAGIAWLMVGDTAVAAIYTLRNGKKVAAYQYGRVVGLPARLRVGIVVNAMAMQEAISRGDDEFDFLAGESRYKTDLANGKHELVVLRLARPTEKEALRNGLVNARINFVAALKLLGVD